MKVTVRVFMEYRQKLGWAEKEIDLPENATIADLLQTIGLPEALQELKKGRGIILKNGKNILTAKGPQEPLNNGDTIVIFPPAGGG